LPLIPLCAADVPLPLEVQHSIYNQIVGQKKKNKKNKSNINIQHFALKNKAITLH
jgi:hypothetical protein